MAASYGKLHSLSATWRRTGYDPASGNFAWLASKPPKLRFEDETGGLLLVSDGVREHLIVSGIKDELGHIDLTNPARGVYDISCEQFSAVFLDGQNPLRPSRWSTYVVSADAEARFLGTATVNGARCRGVEIRRVVEGRDSSYTEIFTL